MIYSYQIDSEIAEKCGMNAALVYAVMKENENASVDEIASVVHLKYHQVTYARKKLADAGYVKLNVKSNVKLNVKLDPDLKLNVKLNIDPENDEDPRACDDNYNKETFLSENTIICSELEDTYERKGGVGEKGEKEEGKTLNYSEFSEFQKNEGEEPFSAVDKNSENTDRESLTAIYFEIINYLNVKAKTHYSPKTKATRQHISARLKEGWTVDDFKLVIDKKVADWKDTHMEKYIRPETLFRPSNFENYVNARNARPKPKAPEKAQSFDANDFLEAALKKSYGGMK